MIQLLHIFVALLVLFCCSQTSRNGGCGEDADVETNLPENVAQHLPPAELPQDGHWLSADSQEDAALLPESWDFLRLLSSRNERTQSSVGGGGHGCTACCRQNRFLQLSQLTGKLPCGKPRRFPSASTDYYVYALRRILI